MLQLWHVKCHYSIHDDVIGVGIIGRVHVGVSFKFLMGYMALTFFFGLFFFITIHHFAYFLVLGAKMLAPYNVEDQNDGLLLVLTITIV